VLSSIKPKLLLIKHYWRSDLIAGFSVSLVALPLSLGIALAMDLPISALMAGVTAALVGGLITTFIRGGNVAINGPSPALIGIVAGAMATLGSWEYVLAAFICSGILQLIFGVLKLGNLADFIPSSVVQGMMAAIGVIILASQVHTGLGVSFKGETSFDNLLAIPNSILNMNPLIAVIFINCLVILAWHPYIKKNRFIKFVPATIWLLVVSIPMYFLFNYLSEGTEVLFGKTHYLVASIDLITLPDNLLSGFFIQPNFAKANTVGFWLVVLSVFLVSTIESLGSAKAIDKIDPLKRKTNLDRDIGAMGISTIISGFIGGLPIVTVIARSSVSIYHGSRTRLSNFVHGILILFFVFVLGSFIQLVPKAALMAILVFTGYKLASPKVFKDASLKGYEQLLILCCTLLATLLTDLNKGILIGILFTLFIHLVRSHMPAVLFFKYISKPYFNLAKIEDYYHLRIKGVANFTNVIKLRKVLKTVPENEQVVFDFSHARLVDFSMLEFVNEWGKDYKRKHHGDFEILGLDEHLTTSEHPYSIHALPQMEEKPLSKRQKQIKELAYANQADFEPKINWKIGYLEVNTFFEVRTIEYAKNKLSGTFDNGVAWEILDVTFAEGALMAAEVHNTTMLRMQFNKNLPDFELDEDRFFTKLLGKATNNERALEINDDFGNDFLVKGESKQQITSLFSKDLKQFLLEHNKCHLESTKNTLLAFRYFRLMSATEIQELLDFGKAFSAICQNSLVAPKAIP
jgi:carbonic anhydrase